MAKSSSSAIENAVALTRFSVATVTRFASAYDTTRKPLSGLGAKRIESVGWASRSSLVSGTTIVNGYSSGNSS